MLCPKGLIHQGCGCCRLSGNASDEEYLELLVKLDKYARKVDKYEYGLPVTLYFEKRLQPENLDEDERAMVNIIKEWMAVK